MPQYYQAIVDGVPQNRRELLKRFIEDIMAIKMQRDREETMRNASVNIAATPQQAFPMPGAPMVAPAPMQAGIAPPGAAEPVMANVGGPVGMA